MYGGEEARQSLRRCSAAGRQLKTGNVCECCILGHMTYDRQTGLSLFGMETRRLRGYQVVVFQCLCEG